MNSASTILMVRPKAFAFNEGTALSNQFQQQVPHLSAEQIQHQALEEFDACVSAFKQQGVEVLVVEDTPHPSKPDAIFPNNWMATGEDWLAVFPLQAESRRQERRSDIMEMLKIRYHPKHLFDYSPYERTGTFLEGTGSMVFDHEQRKVFAALSPRTHQVLVERFAADIGYNPVIFNASDPSGKSIYHTNVLMAVGRRWSVLCSTLIPPAERKQVEEAIAFANRRIIPLTYTQVQHFAGNILELRNHHGESLIVMSTTAQKAFSPEQEAFLGSCGRLVIVDIPTIEAIGGGGVRCMMAEIFCKEDHP